MTYRVKNIAPGPRGIHTPTGLKLLEPGEVREVDLSEGEYTNALTTGHFEIGNSDMSARDIERTDRLREIVGSLAEEDFTAAGVPKVEAINALLDDGEDHITAAERDAVWAAMQG